MGGAYEHDVTFAAEHAALAAEHAALRSEHVALAASHREAVELLSALVAEARTQEGIVQSLLARIHTAEAATALSTQVAAAAAAAAEDRWASERVELAAALVDMRAQRDDAVLQLAAARQEATANAERLGALAAVVAAVTARGGVGGVGDSVVSLAGGREPIDVSLEGVAGGGGTGAGAVAFGRDTTLGSSVSSLDSA